MNELLVSLDHKSKVQTNAEAMFKTYGRLTLSFESNGKRLLPSLHISSICVGLASSVIALPESMGTAASLP